MNDLTMALLTILMSGVSSAVVTHRLNSGREEREVLRKKGEELYTYMHTFEGQIHAGYSPFLEVIRGNKTPDEVDDFFASLTGVPDFHHVVYPKIILIAGIYFPRLDRQLKKILECKDHLAALEQRIRAKNSASPDVDTFRKALADIHSSFDVFNEELIKEANRLIRSWWNR